VVPDVAVRIRSMLRSLHETIIPAIDPHASLALEQAHALSRHLDVLAAQHDKLHQFELAELRHYFALTHELRINAVGGNVTNARIRDTEEVLRQARSLAEELPAPHERVVELVRSLKAAADSLVAAAYVDGTASFKRQAGELTMIWSAKQIERERAWTHAAGLDAFAGESRPLDEILMS
jgi:hypothetical protein